MRTLLFYDKESIGIKINRWGFTFIACLQFPYVEIRKMRVTDIFDEYLSPDLFRIELHQRKYFTDEKSTWITSQPLELGVHFTKVDK